MRANGRTVPLTPLHPTSAGAQPDSNVRGRRVVLAIAVTVVAAIVATVLVLHDRSVRRVTSETLRTAARLQSELLRRSAVEHLREATFLAVNREAWSGTGPPSAQPGATTRRADRFRAIEQERATHGYKAIFVVDAAGRVVHPQGRALGAGRRALLARVMRTRVQAVAPIRRAADRQLEVGAAAPIFAAGDSTRDVVGAVLIETDAVADILSVLSRVDVALAVVETIIGQQEGDSLAVVTAPAHHAEAAPLERRFALTDTSRVVASLFADASRDITEGLDHRGVRVLAVGARVAGTPWIAVAMIELSALSRQERAFTVTIGLSVALLILMAVLAERVVWLSVMRRADQQQFVMSSRYLAAISTSIDGFVRFSADGRLLDVNEALVGMTGYARAELLARSLGDLMIGIPPESVQPWIDELARRGSSRFHSQWRRKDGSVLEIDASTTHLPGEGGGQLFGFVRDISGQMATTNRLMRLNTLYVFLNKAGEALHSAASVEAAYEAVTRCAVEDGQLPLAWVGVVDAPAGVVRPVTWAGPASPYVEQLHITLDPSLPTSHGPTGQAAREGRTVVVNDFITDPRTAPWHAMAAEYGLRSSAAIPVSVDGQVVAAVMFYAGTVGYFDDETMGLLGEISRLLAFVVQASATDEGRRTEERARQASEERFRGFFESSPVATIVLERLSGRVTRVNRAFTELFGYTNEDVPDARELIGRFFPDAAYRAQFLALWKQAAAALGRDRGSVQSPDLRIQCQDGTFRLVQGFASQAGDEMVFALVDITELRLNQATLQRAEEIAKLGSFSYDLRTRQTRTSPDFFRILDLDERLRDAPADDGMPWLLNLAHPDDRERLKSALRVLQDVDQIVRAATPGDERRLMRVRLRLESDAFGRPLRAVGTVQDVTADVLATEELTRLRDHLQDVVDERTAELGKANATLQQSDRRLKAMLEMSQHAATLGEAAILQLGIGEAARLTDSSAGYLHLISDDQRRSESESCTTETRRQCRAQREEDGAPPMAGLWADAVRHRQPLLVNEFPAAAAAPATLPPGHVALTRYLSVPFIEDDRVRLVISVANKATPYDDTDVRELQVIAHDIWGLVRRRRADDALARAYERLQASDQRFEAAMQASSEGVWEWDIPGGTLSVNQSFATLLGYAPTDVAGTNDAWVALMHPEDREAAVRLVEQAITTDAPYQYEVRVRAKDGSYRWLATKGRVVARNAAGLALRAVGTTTDITKRRIVEDELRAAKEQADAANRAKSTFLAVMSHEIRTPLNGVIAMAEILARSPLPPAEKEAVQTIQTSSQALLAVIDDILDFSKIEAGRLELESTDVSLLQLAENLAYSLLPVATSGRVALRFFVDPTVPRLVSGDPTRIRQILYNLTGNAIKFSTRDDGGEGRVQMRIESTPTDPPQIVLHVIDNGIGMSDEVMARLFTSFSQGERSTTRKFGGTGLGLAITKRLVELMHGSIAVQSTLGEGAHFTVTLPLPVVDAAPCLTPHDLTNVSCVVVEDDGAEEAADLRRLLEFAGARVHVVPHEAAAAAEARRSNGLQVVLHRSDGAEATFDQSAFAGAENVRHVALTKGARRMPRVSQPDVVTLDCDLLSPRRLIRAVAVAAGRASPAAFGDANRMVAPSRPVAQISVEEARALGRLILVAEDDRTNQKVILQQLALLGHAAEVAENGTQALQMWRTGNYALLLSDLHMPELDGYTLTQRIRAEEPSSSHLPIVALTANALRGEAARATAAGMDGYLTKPVSLDRLREVLDQYILPVGTDAPHPPEATAAAGPRSDATPPPETTVNPNAMQAPTHLQLAVLAGLVGDDPAVIREFVADFQASARAAAEEIQQANAAGDLTLIGTIAHRLKSSSRAVGALPLGDLCAELEQAGKLGHAGMVADAHRRFVTELALVESAIAAHLASA